VGQLRLGGEHIEKPGFIGVVGTRKENMWHPVTNTTATIPTSFIGWTTLTLVKAICSRFGDQARSVSHDSCVRILPFEFMVQSSLI
jgi:hypothetical protein